MQTNKCKQKQTNANKQTKTNVNKYKQTKYKQNAKQITEANANKQTNKQTNNTHKHYFQDFPTHWAFFLFCKILSVFLTFLALERPNGFGGFDGLNGY